MLLTVFDWCFIETKHIQYKHIPIQVHDRI